MVAEDPVTIRIPGNGTFTVGEDVEVGGGLVLEHSSDAVGPETFEADVFLASPFG